MTKLPVCFLPDAHHLNDLTRRDSKVNGNWMESKYPDGDHLTTYLKEIDGRHFKFIIIQFSKLRDNSPEGFFIVHNDCDNFCIEAGPFDGIEEAKLVMFALHRMTA